MFLVKEQRACVGRFVLGRSPLRLLLEDVQLKASCPYTGVPLSRWKRHAEYLLRAGVPFIELSHLAQARMMRIAAEPHSNWHI